MTKKRLPKSIRKFIRREKARIRRQVLDLKEQEKLISDLYKKLTTPLTKVKNNSLKTLAKAEK
ncbi:MAG: hypothetical protein AAB565_00190 [Patescibacteria group bacterium]